MSEILANKIEEVFPLPNNIYTAFCEVDRKYFLPSAFRYKAYDLTPLPITEDSTISSPLTVAKMTYYLDIDGDVDSVLEIGSGSGFQAAILSQMIRRVFTVERVCKLVKEAKERFNNLKLHNINIKCDDGMRGWNSYAPYDRILLSAYTQEAHCLLSQLSNDGFLIAPIVENDIQYITKIYKNGRVEKFEECEFVPIKEGIE
jgi:protein-L-isoaspartate(D-aspartate) O-methyltransferase